jgi:hypothetical protein
VILAFCSFGSLGSFLPFLESLSIQLEGKMDGYLYGRGRDDVTSCFKAFFLFFLFFSLSFFFLRQGIDYCRLQDSHMEDDCLLDSLCGDSGTILFAESVIGGFFVFFFCFFLFSF